MKKIKKVSHHIWWHGRLAFVTGLVLAITALAVQKVSIVYAETYEFEGTNVRVLSYDKTAPADGKTAIKFTVEFYGYKCTSPDWRGIYIIYTEAAYCNDEIGTDYGPSVGTVVRTNAESPFSGNAQTTGTINSLGFGSKLTGGTSVGHPHHQVIYPGADGRITLSLTSTVAESKHIRVDNGQILDPNGVDFDVTFTAVPGAKKQVADPNAPPPSSAAGDTIKFIPPADYALTEEPEKLLQASTVKLNEKTISASDNKQAILQDEAIVIEGTAAVNSLITLYIFSDPQVVELTADEFGNWSHTITGLPAGSHHIETEVFDPATQTKTGRINLTTFEVIATNGTAAKNDTLLTKTKLSRLALIGITLAIAAAVIFYLSRHRRFAHVFRKKPMAKSSKATKSRK